MGSSPSLSHSYRSSTTGSNEGVGPDVWGRESLPCPVSPDAYENDTEVDTATRRSGEAARAVFQLPRSMVTSIAGFDLVRRSRLVGGRAATRSLSDKQWRSLDRHRWMFGSVAVASRSFPETTEDRCVAGRLRIETLAPDSTFRSSIALAGFQVTINGRFWVTAEPKHHVPRVLPLQYMCSLRRIARSG